MDKKNITSISLQEEMQRSYLEYAMSVIVGRALPDVRDGLKPVQRRILFAMYELGLTPDRPFRKCARVVGDVLGKYHPHGDQAVYDALVRMVQEFSMSLPLVDGQGNFGSIDGDPPAAMRYTETKLAKVSQFLIDQKQCCGNGCLMCPYEPRHIKGNELLQKRWNQFKKKSYNTFFLYIYY